MKWLWPFVALLGVLSAISPTYAFSPLPSSTTGSNARQVKTAITNISSRRRQSSSSWSPLFPPAFDNSPPVILPLRLSALSDSINSDDDDDDDTASPATNPNSNVNHHQNRRTARDAIGAATGVSLTAARATLRAATGFSLTTLYASSLVATGQWIRTSMQLVLQVVPAPLRSVLQPFLVLYYAPLFIVRNLTGPRRAQARKVHETAMEGWKKAVAATDTTASYWPVHLDSEGYLEKDFDEVDVNEAVVEAMEMELEGKTRNNDETK